MAVRTVPDSVTKVQGPPLDVHVLEATLRGLRTRHPGAVLQRYLDHVPDLADDAYVAPGAVLIGQVSLGPQASVWPGCVLRADLAAIRLGAHSNLQDGTVVHLGDDDPTIVGEDVVVGHRAVLHGCTVGDAVLVGIQATLLDGVVVGEGSVIGAGAVVTAGTVIPPHSLVLGVPGRVVKTLGPEVAAFHRAVAAKYVRLAHNHRHG